jgi:copper transport protein
MPRRGEDRRSALRARRRVAVFALATLSALTVGCLAPLVPPAGAHAALVDASPPEGAYLPASPKEVVLTFGEQPDPKLSTIHVLDAVARPVAGVSPVEGVPGYPAKLRVTLAKRLPNGVYSVVWRSVSAVDGHVEEDSYNFGVRVTPPPGAPEGAIPGTSRWISVAASGGRWLLYLGLALMVGASTTCLIALKGRLPAGGGFLLRVAVAVAAVGLAVMTLAERAAVGVPSLLPLFQTREGQYLLYLALALGLCAVGVVLVEYWPRRSTYIALGVFAALAILLHVLSGHANAPSSDRVMNVAAQWMHMTAVGVWVGGLVWLLLGIRGAGRDDRGEAVGRYSQIAAGCLAAVVLTGLFRGIVEVGTPARLFDTSYGRTLLAKVALVAALAGLGALNRFRLVPALRERDMAATPFGRAARSEVVLGVVILATTAVLVGLAPAVTAAVK